MFLESNTIERTRGWSYLFKSNGVRLRLTVLPEIELLVELLGQVSVAAFSKQSDLSVELHAPLENILQVTDQRQNVWTFRRF